MKLFVVLTAGLGVELARWIARSVLRPGLRTHLSFLQHVTRVACMFKSQPQARGGVYECASTTASARWQGATNTRAPSTRAATRVTQHQVEKGPGTGCGTHRSQSLLLTCVRPGLASFCSASCIKATSSVAYLRPHVALHIGLVSIRASLSGCSTEE